MPFRRLKRRHTVNMAGGPGAVSSNNNGARGSGSYHEAGYKDPVSEMRKRKADEENMAFKRMTSDLISYFLQLLQNLVSLFITMLHLKLRLNSNKEVDDIPQNGDTEHDSETEGHLSRKRYNKVVVAQNVVQMFNSHSPNEESADTGKAQVRSKEELLALIVVEDSSTFSSPTAELLKSAGVSTGGACGGTRSPPKDLDSMLYKASSRVTDKYCIGIGQDGTDGKSTEEIEDE